MTKMKKAQASLEYLLLIGGAILVGAIVLIMLTGTTGEGKNEFQFAGNEAKSAADILQGVLWKAKQASPLVADAGEDYLGGEGENITITGDKSGGSPPYTYLWTIAGPCSITNASSISTTVSCYAGGTFPLTFKVTDSKGDTAIDEANLDIY